jgi:hypothetical protein
VRSEALTSISYFFLIVIPAEAGIQLIFSYSAVLDARFRACKPRFRGHDIVCDKSDAAGLFF